MNPGRTTGVQFPVGTGVFLFATTFRQELPVKLVLSGTSMGIKRPDPEKDHSPSSSTEVKNAWSFTLSIPGVVLRHRLNFLLYLCS
jgi:hypothetical protein